MTTDSKKLGGRPKGSGNTVRLLKTLSVGDSIMLPAVMTDAALLQVARNRFYNTAKRLGMKLDYKIQDGNVMVRRVE